MKTFLITIGFIIIIFWIYKLYKDNEQTEKLSFNLPKLTSKNKKKNVSNDVSNNAIDSETEKKSGLKTGMIAIIAVVSIIAIIIIIYLIVRSTSQDNDEKTEGESSGYGRDRYNDRDYDRDYKSKKDYKDKSENRKRGKSLLRKIGEYIGNTYGKYKANKRRIKRIKYNEPRATKDYSIFNSMIPVLLATTPAIRNIYNSRFECIDYNSPDALKKMNALYEGSTSNLTGEELKIVNTLKFVDINTLNKNFEFEEEAKEPKNKLSKDERRQLYSEAALQRQNAAKEELATASDSSKQLSKDASETDKEIAGLQLQIANLKVSIADTNTDKKTRNKNKKLLRKLEQELAQKKENSLPPTPPPLPPLSPTLSTTSASSPLSSIVPKSELSKLRNKLNKLTDSNDLLELEKAKKAFEKYLTSTEGKAASTDTKIMDLNNSVIETATKKIEELRKTSTTTTPTPTAPAPGAAPVAASREEKLKKIREARKAAAPTPAPVAPAPGAPAPGAPAASAASPKGALPAINIQTEKRNFNATKLGLRRAINAFNANKNEKTKQSIRDANSELIKIIGSKPLSELKTILNLDDNTVKETESALSEADRLLNEPIKKVLPGASSEDSSTDSANTTPRANFRSIASTVIANNRFKEEEPVNFEDFKAGLKRSSNEI